MKHLIRITVLALMAISISSCGNQQSKETQEINSENLVSHVYMTTIHCEGCVNTVQTKMPENPGIAEVVADLDSKEVTVSFDPAITNDQEIIDAFGLLGYDASTLEASAQNDDMAAEPLETDTSAMPE